MLVEGNRPFIDLSLQRADGTRRPVRFWVDSGGGGFVIAEETAHALGLTWGESVRTEGREFARIVNPSHAYAGQMRLLVETNESFVALGT